MKIIKKTTCTLTCPRRGSMAWQCSCSKQWIPYRLLAWIWLSVLIPVKSLYAPENYLLKSMEARGSLLYLLFYVPYVENVCNKQPAGSTKSLWSCAKQEKVKYCMTPNLSARRWWSERDRSTSPDTQEIWHLKQLLWGPELTWTPSLISFISSVWEFILHMTTHIQE